ncbi:hypothetical protein BCR37DRAFT_384065 [Protomyces lactucae-debilis]|uniref:Non-homologous end-joining factor 1 n=1 Tax=Protomyces lactucae-debilis TaxID=2754530 RepID=A0A1Y2EV96_PROLT|nr:uncharacterized protein BCR37DRAFT_384065 [Protomyces lactucae-debilis]ORY75437.1 hypothetical protein BCR37DRAFT_384065 [Protomyces lactucae-debilis]
MMHVLAVPWFKLDGHINLLVQFDVSSAASYSIRLTDMRHVWGEDLADQDLISRSEECECPFDQDDTEHLLQQLKVSCLNDHQKSTFKLKQSSSSLRLQLSSTIGSSNIDLAWYFELDKLAHPPVAAGLNLALFGMLAFYQSQLSSLHQVIKGKDGVIRSMTDFCEENNLEYRPRRRQAAFEAFEPDDFAREARQDVAAKCSTAAQIVNNIHESGQDATFREDWRTVLSNVERWELQLLNDEQKPTLKRQATSVDEFLEEHSLGAASPVARADADATTDDEPELEKAERSSQRRSSSPGSPQVINSLMTPNSGGSVKSRIGGKIAVQSPKTPTVKSRIGGQAVSPSPHTPGVKSRIGGQSVAPSPSVETKLGKAATSPAHDANRELVSGVDEQEARRKRLAASIALAQAAPLPKKRRQF